MALDENYTYAMVGNKKDNYLWILSRKPVLDEAIMNTLLEKAASQGFDTSSVIRTSHTCSTKSQD